MDDLAKRVARQYLLAEVRELGDKDFPLVADLSRQMTREHWLVGRRVQVTPYANEVLRPFRGKRGVVTGVIIVNEQIAGLEVELQNGRTFLAPKKDWFIEFQFVEDVYLDSARAKGVRKALEHLNQQRDYYGPSWRGVEAMCEMLAGVAHQAAVEVAGWYQYPSSLRKDQDGKDWRYVIPAPNGAVCVNCHSLLHDNVWSLATTIFNTQEVDQKKLELVGDLDHWTRTLLWELATAKGLAIQGFEYDEVIAELEKRLECNKMLWKIVGIELPRVRAAFQEVFSRPTPNLELSIGFSFVRLRPWAVGAHQAASKLGYSVISVSPKEMNGERAYLRQVVRHELIHYALQTECPGPHGSEFHRMADLVGLEPQHRD